MNVISNKKLVQKKILNLTKNLIYLSPSSYQNVAKFVFVFVDLEQMWSLLSAWFRKDVECTLTF